MAVKAQTSTKPHPPTTSKPAPPPPSTTEMDEEVLCRKTHTIVDELSESNDYQEAMECVKEMKCPTQLHVFVREVVNHTLEKTEHHRITASQLLRDLLRDGELSKDRFKAGLEEVLEYAEDMEIDIPKFWDYMAQLLSHPVSDPSLIPLSLVTSLMPSTLVESGKVGVLAAKVMKQLKEGVCDESAVVLLWKRCGLKWEELGVKGEGLKDLLTEEKLGFLLQPSSHLADLISQFQSIQTTTDDIIKWIDEKCGAECRSPNFIRTLSTALLEAFVTGCGNSARFSADDFRRRSILLKKYANSRKDLHMEILYALQIGVDRLQHPPQLLFKIFNILYSDLEIVDEATFIEWREHGTESVGKGNAVHALKQFFDWLETANPESDPES